MKLSRRQLLATLPAALLAPRRLVAAAPSAAQRRFLFIFCDGGWDVGMVLSPVLHSSSVDAEAGAVLAEEGGITFADHADRPDVRAFFEQHGERSCLINGLEVRSIVHDKCDRLIMTGQSKISDDWGSILAGRSADALLLPYLHISGPMYTAQHTDAVVRVGSSGQLSRLLDGSALTESDMPVSSQHLSADAAASFLQDRASALAGQGSGQAADWLSQYAGTRQQLTTLEQAIADGLQLDLSGGESVEDQLSLAVEALSTGISRCAIVQDTGSYGIGWDTHSGNSQQSTYFNDLFLQLTALTETLQSTTGSSGASMLEEVCVVVFSEMGRHPRINNQDGRDHWTYTSALLIGAGVAGGQTIGGLDDGFIGQPIELASGAITDAGVDLSAAHLGATLLALGDVDPGEYLTDAAPIEAVLA